MFVIDDTFSVDVDVSLGVVKVVWIDIHGAAWVMDAIFLVFEGQHRAEGVREKKTWRGTGWPTLARVGDVLNGAGEATWFIVADDAHRSLLIVCDVPER